MPLCPSGSPSAKAGLQIARSSGHYCRVKRASSRLQQGPHYCCGKTMDGQAPGPGRWHWPGFLSPSADRAPGPVATPSRRLQADRSAALNGGPLHRTGRGSRAHPAHSSQGHRRPGPAQRTLGGGPRTEAAIESTSRRRRHPGAPAVTPTLTGTGQGSPWSPPAYERKEVTRKGRQGGGYGDPGRPCDSSRVRAPVRGQLLPPCE